MGRQSAKIAFYPLSDNVNAPEDIYKLVPLPTKESIRVLTIDTIGDDLRITLKAFDPWKLPPFEALSYEWGKPGESEPILVNGISLPIPRSLHLFLRSLASNQVHSNIYYFADAICINQKNLYERQDQVALMGGVYSDAKLVHIWLGSARAGIDLLFEFCRDLKSDATDHGVRLHFEKVFGVHNEAAFSEAVQAFSLSSYWSRLWIIQEILLAEDILVHCGNHTVGWELLYEGCCRVLEGEVWKAQSEPSSSFGGAQAIAEAVPEDFVNTRYARLYLHSTPHVAKANSTLREVVSVHGLAECTDLRDRVYGLLGLVRNETRSQVIRPDYHESTFCLFIRVMMVCQRQIESVAIKFCRHLRRVLQLPYEASNWSQAAASTLSTTHRFKVTVRLGGTLQRQISLSTKSHGQGNGSPKTGSEHISVWIADGSPINWFTFAEVKSGDIVYLFDQSSCVMIFRKALRPRMASGKRKRSKLFDATFVGRGVCLARDDADYDLGDVLTFLESNPIFGTDLAEQCPLLERRGAPWETTVALSELWNLTPLLGPPIHG